MKLLNTLCMLCIAIASYATSAPSIFDKMAYDDVLKVEIQGDFSTILSDKKNEDKHPATLAFKNAAGAVESWNIDLKVRGKFRRMRCDGFPPLKIYFDKARLAEAGLAGFDDLKLVNYCAEDANLARELIFKEYLAYQMYNELTDASFRVQLLKIDYRDTKTNQKWKQWGFVIEDLAQVRHRIGASKKPKDASISPQNMHQSQTQMVALFQYMIGNADWKLANKKNVKIVEQDGLLLPIPYDFDYSGWVNPPYGRGNADYGLANVTDRVYLGNEEMLTDIAATIELFEAKQKALFKIIHTNKRLSLEATESLLAYLDSFYTNLNPSTIAQAMPKTVRPIQMSHTATK